MGLSSFVAVAVVAAAVCGWTAPEDDFKLSKEQIELLDKYAEMTPAEREAWKKENAAPKATQ